MFPEPFEKFIPKHWERDTKLLAFANKVDQLIADIKFGIFGIADLLNPEKCPGKFLDILGHYVNAGLNPQDTETQKRKKIYSAISGHKKRGSFNFDVKPKIDAIAGGDSQIITQSGGPGWMFESDENSISVNHAIFDNDENSDYGFLMVSAGDVIGWPGNIFIDVDNSSLSAEDQERIKQDMIDNIPAYMYIHFGYFNGSGVFIEYFILPE